MRELPFKVGDEIKNYKEMCKLLDEKVRTGGSKKSQLKRWEKYFRWEHKGYSFIIKEIIESCFPTHDNNMVGHSLKNYNEYIQHLLLDALHFFQQENSREVSLNISHKGLVGIINLFNRVFYSLSFDKEYRQKIAKELNVKEPLLRDFFQRINSTAQSDAESALRQLQKKGLIYVNKTLLVKPSEVYEYGIPIDQISKMDEFFREHNHPELIEQFTKSYQVISQKTYNEIKNSTNKNYFLSSRVATDFEQSGMLLCKHVALKNLGLNTVKHAYALDKFDAFQRETSRLAKKYIGINYSYQGFQIVFSKPVLEKESLLNSFKLSREKVQELQIKIQESFKENVQENYKKRLKLGKRNVRLAHGVGFVSYETSEGLKTFEGEICTPEKLSYSDRILLSVDTEELLHDKLYSLFDIIMRDF